jgi:nucleotide-binding universal stress UspA family protein
MADGLGGPVVVGIDGSDPALEAVRWAAHEAAGREVPLRIVEAVAWTSSRPVGMSAPGQERLREICERVGREHLAAAAELAREIAPGVEIEREVLVGGTVRGALRLETRRAGMLVLASRGRGGFAGLRLGSVVLGVASGAECPVVAVRPTSDADGPVVLGVEAGAGPEPAVDLAFEEAARRKAPLVAVHAWIDAVLDPFLTPHVDWPGVRDEQEKAVADRLAGWTGTRPEVPVEIVVVPDAASRELVSRSAGAALVVVGSRGRSPWANALLGSVSQVVLQHAECPVALVPPVADVEDAQR